MTIELNNVGIKGPKGDTGAPGAPLQAFSGVPITFINPASTFTGITVSNNGAGKVLLTGAGAHGLSAADAIGANVYVISGTGWAASTYYKIISLDADVTGNKIGLDVAFSSQGAPSITTGAAMIAFFISTIAPLGANGIIKADVLVSLKNSVNAKSLSLRSLGVKIIEATNLINSSSYRLNARIHMRGTNQSQISPADGMAGGFGPSVNSVNITSVDFSANRNLTITLGMYSAEPMTIESYLVEVYQ